MRILVGGEARKCGKTTLVCHILRSFRSRRWLAIKVTSHLHEKPHPTGGDTARYRSAGAAEALLLEGDGPEIVTKVAQAIAQWPDWILEGTGIAGSLEADCRLLVRTTSSEPAKPSASDAAFCPDAYIGDPRKGDSLECFAPDSEALIRFLAERWK